MRTRLFLCLLPAAFGCTDPEPIALEACAAVPQLSTDQAGIAALTGKLDPREIKLLEAATPTAGHQAVGTEGLAKIRAGASCVVDQVDGAGTGRWAVKLTRTLPGVDKTGAVGDPIEQHLEWQVVDGADGVVIESGLRYATSMRASLADAVAEQDYKRVASGWRAILKQFPDPVLAVDVAQAEAVDLGMAARKKLKLARGHALDKETLELEVANTSKTDIASATIDVGYMHGEEPRKLVVEVGAIPAGGSTVVQATLADPLPGSPSRMVIEATAAMAAL